MKSYAFIFAILLAGCAGPQQVSQQLSNGMNACLVRGVGGPLTSYVSAGKPVLERLGYHVDTYELTVSPDTLTQCNVIVAHSAGAISALDTTGQRQIFVIDGFLAMTMRCPAGASCTNFYNPGDLLSETLEGADNINCMLHCGVADAIPLLAHMTMPASASVWKQIAEKLTPENIAQQENKNGT